MVRDESHNIRTNLPLWGPSFFDAYVVAVDERTTDDTREALKDATMGKPIHIFNYTFNGFGEGRTEVFR